MYNLLILNYRFELFDISFIENKTGNFLISVPDYHQGVRGMCPGPTFTGAPKMHFVHSLKIQVNANFA